MLIEGPHLFAEALRAGLRPRVVFTTAAGAAALGADSGTILLVDERVLGMVATTTTPQDPVAVIPIPPDRLGPGRLLVAWGVSDPGNCGTLIRIAAAFGFGYAAGPGAADRWSPKVLRSAAGAHFATPTATVDSLADLRRGGRTLVAAVARGGDLPGPLPADAAVLIGSEAHGLPEEVVAAADRRVTIPTSDAVESLNAAVAGAIVAYLGAGAPPTNLPAP